MNTLALSFFLFLSGISALILQTVWMRSFRLVFGASTLSSAAVLAIFMGGLGIGGIFLGNRADRSRNPIRFYAILEFGIGLSAAATPLLISWIHGAYQQLGGSFQMGNTLASLVRIGLSGAVLIVPTFLMGGTLPAVVKACSSNLGILYGINTLGAVAGALLSTFWIIEKLGHQKSTWVASMIYLVIAGLAWILSIRGSNAQDENTDQQTNPLTTPPTNVKWIWFYCFGTGFIFFLMEMVWYRMLTPLLGGSVFTFGLILAVALAGIGIGGICFHYVGKKIATPYSFAITCACEALLLILPFTLGDDIAVWAVKAREANANSFPGLVQSWGWVSFLVLFPPALIAGFQFPLLISMARSSQNEIASRVGWGYAWNTLGAIAGSLLGGFGLLPLMGAPAIWKGSSMTLLILAFTALWISRFRLLPILISLSSLILIFFSTGPTGAWRHSGIGSGRATLGEKTGPNDVEFWLRKMRRGIIIDEDGVESSVSLRESPEGYFIMVNGKTDGSARGDSGTQVMSGLIAAALHKNPTSALVIGLGTGTTAGWLGDVPSVQKVDVIELEPSIIRMANYFAKVNNEVLKNRKVRIFTGDGREYLMNTKKTYDLIVSEPSNPYRAGIANLFTQEYYRSAHSILDEDGYFVQWIQAYETTRPALRLTFSTLLSVFPEVEVWESQNQDLLLVASKKAAVYDVSKLRKRLDEPPYRSALLRAWNVHGLEGFLSRYVANKNIFPTLINKYKDVVNTDDRTQLEYMFAKSLGKQGLFHTSELRTLANQTNSSMPALVNGSLSWDEVVDQRAALYLASEIPPPSVEAQESPERKIRFASLSEFISGKPQQALDTWQKQKTKPKHFFEKLMVAEALATAGKAETFEVLKSLGEDFPVESGIISAQYYFHKSDLDRSAKELMETFRAYQKDPWPLSFMLNKGLTLSEQIGAIRKDLGELLFEELKSPFAAGLLEPQRNMTRLVLAQLTDFDKHCSQALKPYESNFPWEVKFLELRKRCYERLSHPLLSLATRELDKFVSLSKMTFMRGFLKKE